MNVPPDTMKMKIFPATLRDQAKDWFLKLGQEFTGWTEMEKELLRKYYSVGKMVVYDPRRHQGTPPRQRRSRHPRASNTHDRRRRRMPSSALPPEYFVSPHSKLARDGLS